MLSYSRWIKPTTTLKLKSSLKRFPSRTLTATPHRQLHASPQCREDSEGERYDPRSIERAEDDVDVCIVGGGPAGLSAAIRIKQLEKELGRELRVVVLEKGGEIGSHTLSGAVIEPRALDELLPSWQSMPNHPLTQPATSSSMLLLTRSRAWPMPHPPQMSNTGNYVLSLSQFTTWLGSVAEEMGVEVYPGFAGASLVLDGNGSDGKGKGGVRGVTTNDVGITRSWTLKPSFEPGMQFNARVTLLAEGAHGSLTKFAVRHFGLRDPASTHQLNAPGRPIEPQTYGIGVKEVWRVDKGKWEPGKVVHTIGWPMDWKTYGGGWVYHMGEEGLVSLGLVIGLDYKNPWLSPYGEFQKFKAHPYLTSLLTSGERLAYGGRVLNEGGLQSIPQLHFPGGALIGCAAGFVNVAKIKGTHNAMKSGMLAAEEAVEVLKRDAESSGEGSLAPADMSGYADRLASSWVYKDLHEIRNLRPSFNTSLGTPLGVIYSGIDSLLLRGRVPWTFKHGHDKGDAAVTSKASECEEIKYDAALYKSEVGSDLLSSVSLTATNHAEDQPSHLRLPHTPLYNQPTPVSVEAELSDDEAVTATLRARSEHVRINVGEYAGLLGRACPAGVYEYVDDEGVGGTEAGGGWNGKRLVVNSQNCIHCKLCDVKVPTQDINWSVPEGGGGPKYNLT